MHRWEDGTVGYFLKLDKRIKRPSCSSLDSDGFLIMSWCFVEKRDQIICEERGTVADTDTRIGGRQEIQTSKLDRSSIPFPYAFCPSGHWTHKALACDRRSDCWWPDKVVAGSDSDDMRHLRSLCQSPVSALFACRNDVEHVPYSLVCDHSPDCLDASDEDFCVHPSCTGHLQWECTNKQARNTVETNLTKPR